jgi:hypothetical protein
MVINSDTQPLQVAQPAQNNEEIQQTDRALLAWMDDQQAVQVRSSFLTDTIENHLQAIVTSRAVVASRPAYTPIDPFPELEQNDLLEAIKARPQTNIVANGFANWRFEMVDLREVLAFQPVVRIDDLETHWSTFQECQERVYEICFPAERPIKIVQIQDERGYTISSLNPNFSIGTIPFNPSQPIFLNIASDPSLPPVQMPAYPFVLVNNPNYLQVARYQGRYILRNGYHRAVGFLRQGVYRVPCIAVEAQTFEQMVPMAGMFSKEVVLGDHPPRLLDFWDDSVACTCLRPVMRKTFRISYEEINTPR